MISHIYVVSRPFLIDSLEHNIRQVPHPQPEKKTRFEQIAGEQAIV